jgi:hypothetical protein
LKSETKLLWGLLNSMSITLLRMFFLHYMHTHLNSCTVWKTNVNGINFVDKPHACSWQTTCYIKACLSVLEFNMQINWYLSSLYKSMFFIHCFYVYCGYEKRSISEVVKDFNNNIVLVKWYINIIWLVASDILEN